MNSLAQNLPEDTHSLHEIIKNQHAVIEALRAQIAALKRARFGRSSEKLDRQIEQLELMLDEMAASAPEIDIPCESSDAPTLKNHPSRQRLPEDLPREETLHTPEMCCPECGCETYSKIGEDVSEVLDYVPAHFKVLRHVRPKYSCRACETIRQCDLPSMPITKGKAGAGLLAHIIVSKYCDHLPLYRQSEIYARQGIHLSRSTMAGWMRQVDDLVRPLSEALRKDILSSEKLHGDDTTVPVLTPGLGTTKTGRLWVYVRDDRPFGGDSNPAALYCYSADRKGMHPQDHLQNYTGILQADGYAGYNAITAKDSIAEAACWAHVRRKFYEDYENTKSPHAKVILDHIGTLYEIERMIKGKPPDERAAIRQEKALPVIESLKSVLEDTREKISGKSPLAGAIRYALSRWEALQTYIHDGRVEIDNNAAERAMRPVALGRKNYLFAGSDRGGEAAATFYSLIETAKLNTLNPQEYLADMLERIADHPINRIDELLPQNWNTDEKNTGKHRHTQNLAA
jgi:transposase